jgi:hypothetical protein
MGGGRLRKKAEAREGAPSLQELDLLSENRLRFFFTSGVRLEAGRWNRQRECFA